MISSSLGGNPPTGAKYVNFDDMTLGDQGTSAKARDQSQSEVGTINVLFEPDAKVVKGSASGLYAVPYLSGTNGALFGNVPMTGQDETPYLTSGRDFSPNTGARVELSFGSFGSQNYFGILWGSVDDYNTLEFYNGNDLVGKITGTDVKQNANGDQGVNGTRYVNILATNGDFFTSVLAKSSNYAFEFDNVAFGVVPEPGTLAAGLLVVTVGCVNLIRRGKRLSALDAITLKLEEHRWSPRVG